MMTLPILFEDDFLLFINKPAGVVVNRAESVQTETIQDWMESRQWYGKWEEKDEELKALYLSRSGMVHRLDKDTSGVLVLAKDPQTMSQLMTQFRERETKKTYRALVHGKMAAIDDTIRLPLGRDAGDRQKFSVDIDGKMSETTYHVLEYYPNAPAILKTKQQRSYQGFSYLKLFPKTGRTHQIRVHLKHINHPLVGDHVYVGRKRSALDSLWCPRQFLHAKELCIEHPKTGEHMCISCDIPQDLSKVLLKLTPVTQ